MTTEQTPAAGTAEYWQKQVDTAIKNTEGFRRAGEFVVRQFIGGQDIETEGETSVLKGRYNLFHSNVKVLSAMLYSSQPRPTVTREHADPLDDVARIASQILERALRVNKRSDVDRAAAKAVFDRLTPGLGAVWLRYDVKTEQIDTPAQIDPFSGEEIAPAGTEDRIISEDVLTDYVYWQDLLWEAARTWEECGWTARRLYMTKSEVRKRWPEFAEELTYSKLQPTGSPKTGLLPKTQAKYAQIYEIWHKKSRKIYWLAHQYSNGILEVQNYPFELSTGFPCPEPLRAVFSTSNFTPRSDYALAKDQYETLNTLNQRVTLLVEACQVIGVYDKTNTALKDLLGTGNTAENRMVAVDNWAMFAERGGLKGVVDWFPLDAVVSTIERLRVYRQDLVNQLYELTGMSDILRGDTRASETLGAQQLKAQFANVRVGAYKKQVGVFLEELLNIKYEIMAQMFSDESWLRAASVDVMYVEEPLIKQAIALLKDPEKAKFRINISVDSLSQADATQDRDDRLNVVRASGDFLKAIGPLAGNPAVVPYLLKFFQWVMAAFPSADQIETVLDQASNELERYMQQQKANPQPQPPSPEQVQMQVAMQTAQQDAQIKQQAAQQDAQIKQQTAQQDAQLGAMDLEAQMAKNQMDLAATLQKHQLAAKVTKEKAVLDIQAAVAKQRAADIAKPKSTAKLKE